MSISIDVVELTMTESTETPSGTFKMTIPFNDVKLRDIRNMSAQQALVIINYIEICTGNERVI